MDKKFIVQALVSLSVFSLCSFQIITKPEKEAIYWSGITSILFYWLPSPSEKNETQ